MNEVIEFVTQGFFYLVVVIVVVVGSVATYCSTNKDNAANYKDQNGVDRTQNRTPTR